MDKILFCEDDPPVITSLLRYFKIDFPNYNILSAPSVRGGLTKATGVDLRSIHPVSVDAVVSALANENTDNLKIVFTDGELIDPSAGAGDTLLMGWHLAGILHKIDYQGKVVYAGGTDLPPGTKNLFDKIIDKNDQDYTQQLVAYAKQTLMQE